MKQLKFNPDKDMKELEKYGFKSCRKEYYIQYQYFCTIIIINRTTGILETKATNYTPEQVEMTWVIIYDLIKANLLIVESDKDGTNIN